MRSYPQDIRTLAISPLDKSEISYESVLNGREMDHTQATGILWELSTGCPVS